MYLAEPTFFPLQETNEEQIGKKLERIARVCYKSEDRITDTSWKPFLKGIIRRGHESIIEHEIITIHFVTDRAIANEMVRHRIAAYAQESTRFVNYKIGVGFICPDKIKRDSEGFAVWKSACEISEQKYLELLKLGYAPETCRGVLNLNAKTEIVATYNLREWRHVLKLRTAKDAHPDIRKLMVPVLEMFKQELPTFFEDIQVNE